MAESKKAIDIDNILDSLFVIKSTISLIRTKYEKNLEEDMKNYLSIIEKSADKISKEMGISLK